MTDQILTHEHIRAIRAAHDTVMAEIDAMPHPEIWTDEECIRRSRHYRRRLAELCPDALAAWDAFREERREAAKRIDPYTCEWQVTYLNLADPYGITGESGAIKRSLVIWEENSNGPIEDHDLSAEQYKILKERIELEAKNPVLSSFSITPTGAQLMPMPSSRDPEAVLPSEIALQECLNKLRADT